MTRYRIVLSLTLLALAVGTQANAQHLWMDVNGDGECTDADMLSPSVTHVDVYLDTDSNQDGSSAVCASGDGTLTLNSYSLIFIAPQGGIAWNGFAVLPGWHLNLIGFQENYAWFGAVANSPLTPGTHELMELLISVTGNPPLEFATSTPYQPGAITDFGSDCLGTYTDHLIRYGTNFTGACGTAVSTSVAHTTWGKIKNLFR